MQNENTDTTDKPRNQVISYFNLRFLIGATGFLMPVLVILGKWFSESSWTIEPSISDYYDNSAAGDILVGVLFVMGFFLMSYRGHEAIDNRTANIGWIAALGVALFPTMHPTEWVHYMHFVFAFVLFSVFIFFSLYLFRKTNPDKTMTENKKSRNKIYFTCGIIMVLCIAAIAASMLLLDKDTVTDYDLVFWFESVALMTFGFSWITKSESLFLKDE